MNIRYNSPLAAFMLLLLLHLALAPRASAKNEAQKTDVKVNVEIQKSGYKGEVFEYTVTLLSSSPEIADIRVSKAPVFPAGMKSVRGVVRNSRPVEVDIKGKKYYSWTIMRQFLLPDEAGKYKIGKADFVAFIPHVAGYYTDFWGRHQVMDYEEVNVSAREVDFTVKDLPKPKPGEEFSGCVGEFSVEGWFPPGNIIEGRDAYAVFTVSGFGSLKDLKIPNIYRIFGDGCELKEVEQSENQSQRDGRMFSEVTLTCRFVPHNESFTINPLCLLFFSPESGRYELKCSDTLQWTGQKSQKTDRNPSKDAIEI